MDKLDQDFFRDPDYTMDLKPFKWWEYVLVAFLLVCFVAGIVGIFGGLYYFWPASGLAYAVVFGCIVFWGIFMGR